MGGFRNKFGMTVQASPGDRSGFGMTGNHSVRVVEGHYPRPLETFDDDKYNSWEYRNCSRNMGLKDYQLWKISKISI